MGFVILSCGKKEKSSKQETLNELLPPDKLVTNEEWVLIPANAGNMGLSAFYAMKYEAKAMLVSNKSIDSTGLSIDLPTHTPVSVQNHNPWRSITAVEASAECESRGNGYRLMSNSEWMAIARDIEMQDENWSGNSVGSGCLSRGNSGEADCGYIGVSPEAGENRNSRSAFRLSNSNVIYDIAGNVNEWIDWDSTTPGFQLGPITCSNNGWQELSELNCSGLVANDYLPINLSYDNTTKGIGLFFGGSNGATMRGGSSASTDKTAIYSLLFYFDTSYTSTYGGFRCVYSNLN